MRLSEKREAADSQAAIILEQSVAERTRAVLFQLRDSAYAAQAILQHSVQMGSVPIIEKRDYHASSGMERNSDLQANQGLRACGAAKAMTHLMLGLLVINFF